MHKVFFTLAIHNHQPVGNFEYVTEEAYSKAYLPFLNTLERHPDIKVVLHYCGVLYSFFEKRHPEFLELLRTLIKRGQAEILTGGFYEPLLPVLPEVDGIGQIRKMTDFIRSRLDYDPKGIWIAERVWEPHLPALLGKAGVCYTTLDDFHFKLSGLRDQDLRGYYLTDDGESAVGIFPGCERLRYLIPFHLVEEISGFLSERASKGNVAVAMADDGEKFGVWPDTYRSVYEEGWLERFFGMLEANKDWIQTITFYDYWRNNPPSSRVYLQTTSYREMGEWSLPADAIKEYEEVLGSLQGIVGTERARTLLRGGFWRNFLSKYPESNNLHKKMVHVSKKVHKAINELGVQSSEFREKRSKKTPNTKLLTPNSLLEELWQGQCNDGYWHGVFGGIYLPHLRTSLYEHLIKAEIMADSVLHKVKLWLDVEERDIDLDTRAEILIGTPSMTLYIDPWDGGSLFEWDYRQKAFNLINTFARSEEGYHYKVHEASVESSGLKTIHERTTVKEEGLDKHLRYDRYRRVSLLDHFLPAHTSLSNFVDGEYEEQGDFISSPYESAIRREGRGIMVSLKRGGKVKGISVNLEKTLTFKPDKPIIDIEYRIGGEGAISSIFGVEFNISLSGKGPGRYLRLSEPDSEKKDMANPWDFSGIRDISMVDEWLGIAVILKTEPAMDLWHFPLETISQSEGGFERIYQHSVIFPHWTLDAIPESGSSGSGLSLQSRDSEWKGKITLSVEVINQ